MNAAGGAVAAAAEHSSGRPPAFIGVQRVAWELL